MSYLLLFFIFLPVVAMAAVALSRRSPSWPALLTGLALTILAAGLYSIRPFNQLLVYQLGTNLVLDGFSHAILLAANLAFLLAIIYSTAYVSGPARYRYWLLLLALLAGVNGVLLAGDLLTMIVFLELAALSGYALTAFDGEKKQLEAAFKYFILGEAATVLLLVAAALILSVAGSFDLAVIAGRYPAAAPAVKLAITALLLSGLAMKAGLAPFHAWLPDAYSAAPAPVSAIFSGVVSKVLGVYLLVRLIYNVLGMSWQVSAALLFLGGLSIFVGGFLGIAQKDIKRLIACSSISQIGYICVGFGLGTPLGIMGGIFHLLNHVFMKSLLFLSAGSIEKGTGTRDLDNIGGLLGRMPATAATTLAGSLAVSGIPPFNGFWSKLFIILACVQSGRLWLAAVAILGGLLTLAAFLKMLGRIFWGGGERAEVSWPMIVSQIVMAGICLAIGLNFPYLLRQVINPAVIALLSGTSFGQLVGGGL